MKKVTKNRLDILNILVKRLGDEAGKKVYNQILYVKNKIKNNVEVPVKNK